jgi:uncharacterized protein with PQ loop repeat
LVFALAGLALSGCDVQDTSSLLVPTLRRSEIFGLIAGFGTTFAAFPDLLKMLRSRSSKGMNPMMAGIMGAFQVLWIYYGLLIASRPVILWNILAVVVNCLTVGAYLRFSRQERERARSDAGTGLPR